MPRKNPYDRWHLNSIYDGTYKTSANFEPSLREDPEMAWLVWNRGYLGVLSLTSVVVFQVCLAKPFFFGGFIDKMQMLGGFVVLSSIVYIHPCHTSLYRITHTSTILKKNSRISRTRAIKSNTTPTSCVPTRTCGTMHYTHASHAMCATSTTLTLTLHHALSSECA